MAIPYSVAKLEQERHFILSLFDTDCTADDEVNMEKLYDVERRIALADFDNDAAMLAGQRMLFDMGATPATFDNFKTALFLRMQKFAS